VDEAACDVAGGAIKSSLFPDAFYSYQTCSSGSTGSIERDALTIGEIGGLVEDYLYANAAAVENAYAATSNGATCDYTASCPCLRCEFSVDWHCTSGGMVDLESAVLFERENGYDHNTASARRMQCMAGAVNGEFLRVAAKEHVEHPDRIGFQMFGGQESGAMANWPAVEWCSDEYDPRFRPWYSSAASGPKDIVIVIDISGSMATGERIAMAKDAVNAVIDTLTWSDHAALILFDDTTLTYETIDDMGAMAAMTVEEKENMKEWAEENIQPNGGTNFDGGFDAAFQALNSDKTSACSTMILFMTDGESSVNHARVRSNALSAGARVMT
jgi:hypothetical protein